MATASSSSGPPAGEYLTFLARYLSPLWRNVLLLTFLMFLSIVLQLLIPQFMARFIDSVQAAQPLAKLTRFALAYLGVALFQQAANTLATYVAENLGWRATNSLRNDLARHSLRLDLTFHNLHSPGEMIERIDGDVTALSEFFSRFVVQVAGNIFLAIGILIALFGVDWRVGLSITLFAMVTFIILLRFRNLAVPAYVEERKASADLFGFLEEHLTGIEDIKANGAIHYVLNKFTRYMQALLKKSLQAALYTNFLLNIMFIAFAVGNALAFSIGASLFYQQTITLGVVYLIFQYTSLLERPVEDLARQLGQFQKAGASIQRVKELLAEKSSLIDSPAYHSNTTHPYDVPDDLRKRAFGLIFEEVCFAYHDQLDPNGKTEKQSEVGIGVANTPHSPSEVVLDQLNLNLEPGKVLGLLGRTGSGKTSLIRLIFRFYDPDSGSVRIYWEDSANHGVPAGSGRIERDLREIPLNQLRGMMGVIPQNVQLFDASIRSNLTFFREGITDDQILWAIEELGLMSWFRNLPAGLDTRLESGGSGLSAGQAQLLAFTRVFLRNPKLIILDEASSRLDPATERLIEVAVERLLKDRTAIIVAHRLATVLRADQLLILEAGRVLEAGSRAALASDPNSNFSRLLKAGLDLELT